MSWLEPVHAKTETFMYRYMNSCSATCFLGFSLNRCMTTLNQYMTDLNLCIDFFALMHLSTWTGSNIFFQNPQTILYRYKAFLNRHNIFLENLNRCMLSSIQLFFLHYLWTGALFFNEPCSLMNQCILQIRSNICVRVTSFYVLL
jgi:hypothetical protein